MAKIVLYSARNCHLCDIAYSMLVGFIDEQDIEKVNIFTDQALIDAYKLQIPVLKRCDAINKQGQAPSLLFWPFNETQLEEFLK